MKSLKFFGKENPKVRELLKISKVPEKIVFEREEEAAIKNELEQNMDMLQKRYPDGVIEVMESGFAATALKELSERKLGAGDLRAAYSCCVKSLALLDVDQGSWLLLAEILARHGATDAARRCLNYAQEVFEKNEGGKVAFAGMTFEEIWQKNKKRVLDIIEKKQG